MKYQNFSYVPGYLPLYGFEIKSEANVPLDIDDYQFRFEAFDKAGTRVFLEETPTSIEGHWVYFTISEEKGAVFLDGNYNYRLVVVNTLGQTRQVYKGFITVDAPINQPPPDSGTITPDDIVGFDAAVIDAVDQYVADAIAAATFGDATTPQGLVKDNPNFDNAPFLKVKHDELMAQGGGVLTAPAGHYWFKNITWWHPSVSLVGRGRNQTVFHLMANATCAIQVLARSTTTDGTYAPNPEFRSFHLDCHKNQQTVDTHGIVFMNPVNDPDAHYEIYGDKGFASGRIIDVEVTNTRGAGIWAQPHRTRLFLSNTRSLFATTNGLLVAANDPIIGERCGFGNCAEHSVKFSGCSGALIKGANIWGNAATRSIECLAIHFQNCNSVNVVGNVINDTISVYGGETQDDRGVVISANVLKPHRVLFNSDGVTVDDIDQINCHVRVRGNRNVVIDSNAFDAAATPEADPPLRYKYLVVCQDGASARVNVSFSTENDTKSWSGSTFEPFLVDNDSQLTYTMYETTRKITRSNGTVAYGLLPGEDADVNYDLTARFSRFTSKAVFDGPLVYPSSTSTKYIALTTTPISLVGPGIIYVFTGGDLATADITLPATPDDGRQITMAFTQNITALTIRGAGTDTFTYNIFPRAVTAMNSFTFVYRAAGGKWTLATSLPSASLTNDQVVAGAIGVVGHTSSGTLVMNNGGLVTLASSIQSYLTANVPAPGGTNTERIIYISDKNEGVIARSNGSAWIDITLPKSKFWIDPKVDHFADNTGATNASTAFNAALTTALTPALSGVSYGRGKPVSPYPGQYLLHSTPISSHLSLTNKGSLGAVVFRQDHSNISATTAMFVVAEDGASDNGIVGQPIYSGIAIDGQRTSSGAQGHAHAVHGVYAPTAVSQGKLMPAFEHVQISRIKGDCVKFNGFDEYRSINSKFVDSSGYGLNLTNSRNGYAIQSRYMNNMTGAHYLSGCDNYTFAQCDLAPSTGGTFNGRWMVEMINSYAIRYSDSRIEGPIRVQGTNNDSGSPVQYFRRNIRFDGVQFIVSKAVKDGYTTNHNGDNNYIYDAQLEVRDCSGIDIDTSSFRFGSTAPTVDDLAARPDYFIKFTSQGGQTSPELALKRGSVKIGSIDFVTREMREGVVPVIMPFKKRPFSHDEGVTWTGRAWDEPALMKKDTAGRGWLLADGTSGLSVADYPLAYLAGSKTRTLDDGTVTFTVQEISMAVPDETWGWFLQAF